MTERWLRQGQQKRCIGSKGGIFFFEKEGWFVEDRKGTSRTKRNGLYSLAAGMLEGGFCSFSLVRTMLASNEPESRYATYSNTIPTVWQVGSLWLEV